MRIAWTGELPDHWSLQRGAVIAKRVRRAPRDDEGVVTAFRDGQVTLRTNRRVDGFTEAFKEIGYQGIRKGDLVIHGMDGFAGAIGVSDSDGKASPVVHAYRVDRGDARFFTHALRAAARAGYIESLAKGIRERSTAFDAVTFKNLVLPVPPAGEQRMIADFLDRETGKIDALIKKQTELITRLHERRAEVRADAVLGRHQGQTVETEYWFGAIPAGWTTPRLSHHHTVVLGRMINAATARDDDLRLPYIAAGSIQPDELVLDESKSITVPAGEAHKYSLAAGDVVVVEGGAGYGRSAVLDVDLDGWVFQNHVARVRGRTGDSDPRYVREVLEVCRLSGFFEANNRTATLPSLSREVLGSLRIPLPPIDEQRFIADQVLKETVRIDELIGKTERMIELSRERRAALITAAVTGQIDINEQGGVA